MALSGINPTIIIIAVLAFIVVGGLGFALSAETSQDIARRRAKNLGVRGTTKDGANDEIAQRRKQTQNMLKKMREQEEQRRSVLTSNDVRGLLSRAGLEFTPQTFYIYSGLSAAVFGFLMFLSGIEGLPAPGPVGTKSRPAMVLIAMLFGGLLLPRFALNSMANSRSNKVANQFADALDVLVRGIKSGLPITEGLQVIAQESPEPLGAEFKLVADNLKMGTTLERALLQMYKRNPISDINFFVIVMSIQAKSGGNLSEALGNLSSVIRARKMMKEKVKALSAEAKASGYIIGALPIVVGLMVYFSTPNYIMELFITETGNFFLLIAGVMMFLGIMVMRMMMNFDS